MKETILSISLKDYKRQIEDLKGSLLGLEQNSKQYVSTVSQIESMQKRLNDAMNAGKGYTNAAEGSYNSLVQKMKELKEVWRSTADEAERNALGKQINDINDQLKALDASIGNYQRNVGNYANAFKEGFAAMGSSLGGLVAQAQSAGNALKAMASSNPYILAAVVAITALVKLIGAMKDAIKNDEQQQNKWNQAMAKFQPILLAVNEMLSTLAEYLVSFVSAIGDAIGWVMKANETFNSWLESLGSVGKAIQYVLDVLIPVKGGLDLIDSANKKNNVTQEKTLKLARDEANIREFTRKAKLANARIDERMAKREEDIARARKNNAAEYHRLLKLQQEDRAKIAANNEKMAKNELYLAQQRAALGRNSREENEALMEAQIKYNNTVAQNARDTAALVAKDLKVQEDSLNSNKNAKQIKEQQDLLNKTYERSIGLLEEQNRMEADLLKMEIELGIASENVPSEETFNKRQDLLQLQMNGIRKVRDELEQQMKDENLSVDQRLAAEKKYNDAVFRLTELAVEEKALVYKQEVDDRKKAIKEELELYKSVFEQNTFNLSIQLNNNESMFQLDERTYDDKLEIEYKLQTALLQQEDLFYEKSLQQYDEYLQKLTKGTEEYNNVLSIISEMNLKRTELGQKQYELDLKHNVEVYKSDKKYAEQKKKSYKELAMATADLFGTMNEAIQTHLEMQVKDGKLTEEEAEKKFEKTKALLYSEAVLNTLAGAIGGFMGAMKDNTIQPSWLRPVLGAVYASTATATGLAQIMQIKSTTLGGGSVSSSTGSGASVAQAQVSPLLNESLDSQSLNTINLQTVADNSTRDSRVYILESDLQKSGSKVNTREKNSSF